ncbi:G patch domain-containing protein 4 [Passer domesticus]|uniref:G patch domain-containing protein 4 n=1 Tax=Passer domesticus TaxID=48849 RepID=UPI0030FED595
MSAAEPPGRGMLFAETQLRRHGWRRGQGLGRRQDGIAEAIRVKVKCDTAGVGHDAAEPFTFHWWDHVFNEAAANIAVEAGQDGISVKALCEQAGSISNKKPRKAGSSGSLLYGRFVKSATLTACGEEAVALPAGSESSQEEEEKLDLSSVRRLTDEELVQACGGRTAHKGARHGLTMSAKLARLEEQERAFLATYRQRGQQQEHPDSSQGKKKKRKQSGDGAEVPQSREPNTEQEEVLEEKVIKKKKKKKQGSSREEELTGEEEVVRKKKKKKVITEPCGEEVSGEEGKVMKRRKKPEQSTDEEVVEEDGKAAKRRKKKKKKKQEEEDREEPAETDVPLQETDETNLGYSPIKKRKKKKRKKEPE